MWRVSRNNLHIWFWVFFKKIQILFIVHIKPQIHVRDEESSMTLMSPPRSPRKTLMLVSFWITYKHSLVAGGVEHFLEKSSNFSAVLNSNQWAVVKVTMTNIGTQKPQLLDWIRKSQTGDNCLDLKTWEKQTQQHPDVNHFSRCFKCSHKSAHFLKVWSHALQPKMGSDHLPSTLKPH